MARKGISVRSHFWHDILIMVSAFILGLFLSVGVFELLSIRYNWFEESSPVVSGLHGAASVPATVPATVPASTTTGQAAPNVVLLSVPQPANSFASVGQENVSFMKFTVSSPEDSFLQQLHFTLNGDNLAHPFDLQSLQLLYQGKLLAEVPFMQGEGLFQNLMVKLPPHLAADFEIKGKVSTQALSGSRVRLVLKDQGDIIVTTPLAEKLSLKAIFPLQGDTVSVIGNKLGR
jgi:hypothetical protein